jgi:uncharacterized protein (TIGR02246 family)
MKRIACAVAFCLAASAAIAQDKATIEKLNDAFEAAFAKGDAAALAGMYAEDATVLPSGAPMAKGRAAIQAFWGGAIAQLSSAKLTTLDVRSLGPEYAQELGTFALTTTAQPPQTVAGKYVVIWKKAGSSWQLSTDIWNADK